MNRRGFVKMVAALVAAPVVCLRSGPTLDATKLSVPCRFLIRGWACRIDYIQKPFGEVLQLYVSKGNLCTAHLFDIDTPVPVMVGISEQVIGRHERSFLGEKK